MERLPVSRLQSIDLLRGLAALAVVLIHIPHRVPAAGAAHDLSFWLLLPIDYGFLGVMMFIVLSGFCLHANALRETASQPPGRFAIDWPGFWRRRARRLYLPYLVVVLLGVFGVTAFYYVAGPRFSLVSQYFDEAGVPNGRLAADALLHASLLHNLVGGFETSLGNSPLWSLGMEAQLYVLFVVYIVLRRRVGLSGTVATVFLVSTVGWSWWSAWGPRTVGVGGATLGDWHFHPLKYWLAWVLGTLIAEAHAGRLVLPRWCARGVVGAALLLAYVATHGHVCTALFGEPRFEVLVTRALGLDGAPALALQAVLVPALRLLSPLGCFVLVNACVQSELAHGPCARRWARALAGVGVFSYSLYLVHMPLIWIVERVLRLGDRYDLTTGLLRYALCVPICLIAGWVFYRLVEKPFLAQRPKAKPAPAPAPVAAGI